MAVAVQDEAPDFTLQDQNGDDYTLSDDLGTWIALYFYPKDDTPGCTKEACGFRDRYDELADHIHVVGVSSDSVSSHKNFEEKYQLPFTLLSDPDSHVRTLYGADNSVYPKRTTFLIDPEGVVVKVYEKVDVAAHAGEILKDVETLAFA